MSAPPTLSEPDVYHIVRILGEVAVMKPDPDARRIYLINELAKLLNTDTWIWGVAPMLDPGTRPDFLYQYTEGFGPERMVRFLEATEHPDTVLMTAPLAQAISAGKVQITRTMRQLVSQERFKNSPAKPLWDAADISQLLFILRIVKDYGFSCIVFYRRLGEAEFSERDCQIAHLILNEVPLLHQVGMPHAIGHPMPQLPPRCRFIINLLVHGESRKTIATHLGLSGQTVNGYFKKIFTHFKVHSQAELIARLTHSDDHDP